MLPSGPGGTLYSVHSLQFRVGAARRGLGGGSGGGSYGNDSADAGCGLCSSSSSGPLTSTDPTDRGRPSRAERSAGVPSRSRESASVAVARNRSVASITGQPRYREPRRAPSEPGRSGLTAAISGSAPARLDKKMSADLPIHPCL